VHIVAPPFTNWVLFELEDVMAASLPSGILAVSRLDWQDGGMDSNGQFGPEPADELAAALDAGAYDVVDHLLDEAVGARRSAAVADDCGADDLRELIREGMDSGPDLDGDAVFAYLRARFCP
jgi:hypothetical protein